jgi:hypothetical protein
MARRFLLLFAIALAGLTLVAAGCGGDDDESSEEAVPALTETTEEATEEEATEEETTTEEEATEEETTTEESGDTGGASTEDCQEFAQATADISSALTGSTDPEQLKATFEEITAAAPDEIKDDFETLSEYVGAVADAGTDATKLAGLDTSGVQEASQNITTWMTENCGAAATP